jgi:hypothetical protein
MQFPVTIHRKHLEISSQIYFYFTVKSFEYVSGANLTALHNQHTQRSRLIFEKLTQQLITECHNFYVHRNLVGCVHRLHQFSQPTARLIQSTCSHPISSRSILLVKSLQYLCL